MIKNISIKHIVFKLLESGSQKPISSNKLSARSARFVSSKMGRCKSSWIAASSANLAERGKPKPKRLA